MIYHWWLDRKTNNGYAYANNIFSSEELDAITKIGLDQSLSSVEKPLVGQNSDSDYRICETSFIRSDIDSNQWIFMRLTDVITEINKQYFNFDLDYIQNLQFTSYAVGGHYGRHTDLANAAERPRKLSFVLQLSDMDQYDDGELKIYYSDEPYIAQKIRGTLTVFPSYALHEVTPITRGTRHSLVGWVCGPCFK